MELKIGARLLDLSMELSECQAAPGRPVAAHRIALRSGIGSDLASEGRKEGLSPPGGANRKCRSPVSLPSADPPTSLEPCSGLFWADSGCLTSPALKRGGAPCEQDGTHPVD